MTEPNALCIKILDKEYLVSCPEGHEAKLIKAGSLLNKKMREIKDSGRVLGIERIAVMAALNLTHELINAKPTQSEAPKEFAELIEKIDQALQDRKDMCFDF